MFPFQWLPNGISKATFYFLPWKKKFNTSLYACLHYFYWYFNNKPRGFLEMKYFEMAHLNQKARVLWTLWSLSQENITLTLSALGMKGRKSWEYKVLQNSYVGKYRYFLNWNIGKQFVHQFRIYIYIRTYLNVE